MHEGTRNLGTAASGALAALVLAAAANDASGQATVASAHAPAHAGERPTRFAVIGDYGLDGPGEAAVAALVAGFDPDFVITVGDNNYPDGEAATIDVNIGKHYHAFIAPYLGAFGPGAATNRFFPALGNHDWNTPGALPYLAWFALPGNERYYTFRRGPVALFAVDSDPAEPDGIDEGSTQAAWLRAALAASDAPFELVYFHHAPYSSGVHGGTHEMRWPFRAWGADVVLAGHDHHYERIVRDGFPYFVDGLGGASITTPGTPIAGSALVYNDEYGAMLVEATEGLALFRMISVQGTVADMFALRPEGVDYDEVQLVAAGSTWKYRDDGSNQGSAWRTLAFDDSGWPSGAAELGYGDGDETTVVQSGPSGDHFVTTYYRRAFTVLDPTQYRDLALELLCDDGAAVYLNGVEVARENLPAGSIASTTLAVDAVGGAEEDAFHGFDVSPQALVAGANLLAVEIHQVSGRSSDTSFDLALRATLAGTVLSPRGATWRYRDDGVFPGAGWTAPAYDDAAWANGAAELGYGDGDEATVVSFGPNPAAKHPTTWFRRTFVVADASVHDGVMLRLRYDDGAIAYLNGTEVFRINLPFAGATATTFAAAAIAGADESRYVETFVDPRLLHDGANVLAVEIHQQSGSSSDVSFDLELLGL